jgi:ribonuclease HI
MAKHLLQFDGAAEPNPGPAGGAYVLFSPITTDELGNCIRIPIQEGFKFIGKATNNEAEYTGLILGLEQALKLGISELEVEGDSTLVVNQVQGKWKVKAANLAPHCAKAMGLLRKFKTVDVKYIPREENADADALSKEAVMMRREEHR